MEYYNIHAHIFTMNNAPKEFLSLYMPAPVANAIDSITNTSRGEKIMEKILNMLPGKAGKKYASFLHVGKRSGQMDVFRDLLDQYADSSLKITALTLYMEKLGAGESLSGFEGQLEEIINVKKRYPDRLLVFFGLDPRWKANGLDISSTINTYFNNKINIDSTRPPISPFVGLKLYPSTGFYFFDEKLKPTLKWAADNNLPIMTHCNYLGGIFNNDSEYLNTSLGAINPYTGQKYPAPRPGHLLENKFFKKLLGTQKAANNQGYCSYFLEPASYESVLNDFITAGKPLKICFAHFGGSEHMNLQYCIEYETDPKKKKKEPGGYFGVKPGINWCAQIQALLQLPGVYTDVSYALTDHATHDFIFAEMRTKNYKNKILFGTDFFMTEREAKEKDTYTLFRKKAQDTPVTKLDGTVTNVWEMMARENVEQYLHSTYY